MAPPYTKDYIPLKDVDRYFKLNPQGNLIFIGESLELRIPQRLQSYNLMTIGEYVETVVLMDMIFDDTYRAALHLLVKVAIQPTEITNMVVDSVPYVVLKLYTGDVFISNTTVVKDKNIMYGMYVEYMTRGNLPYWYTYNDAFIIFDQSDLMCDSKLPSDHAIFECLIAHLARDQKDLFKFYRHTDMVEKPVIVPLRSVRLAPDSTTARIAGSYLEEGMLASLLNENKVNQPFEDLFRGLPLHQEQV